MNDIVQNMQASYGVFENLLHQMLAFLPSLIGFILFLLFAWLFYKFCVWLVSRILKSIKLDQFFQKKFPGIESWKFRLHPATIILAFTKMTLLLIFVVLGSEILGLPVLSQELAKLLNFLPRIVIAVALLFLGFNISGAARDLIYTVFNSFGLAGTKLISTLARLFDSVCHLADSYRTDRHRYQHYHQQPVHFIGGHSSLCHPGSRIRFSGNRQKNPFWFLLQEKL